MTEEEFQRLEDRIEELITICGRLKQENRLLRSQQEAHAAEKAGLIDKNQAARSRVEAMINRLKALEHAA